MRDQMMFQSIWPRVFEGDCSIHQFWIGLVYYYRQCFTFLWKVLLSNYWGIFNGNELAILATANILAYYKFILPLRWNISSTEASVRIMGKPSMNEHFRAPEGLFCCYWFCCGWLATLLCDCLYPEVGSLPRLEEWDCEIARRERLETMSSRGGGMVVLASMSARMLWVFDKTEPLKIDHSNCARRWDDKLLQMLCITFSHDTEIFYL